MIEYPRMKRFGSISYICTAVLLSACSVTQLPELSPEDAAAQALAAQELDDALRQEYRTAAAEAREAEAEAIRELRARMAREKAEEEQRIAAEAAEYAARLAAEKAEEEQPAETEPAAAEEETAESPSAPPRRGPGLLTSRARKADKKQNEAPTAEQQAAARRLLAEQATPAPAKTAPARPQKKEAQPATMAETRDEQPQDLRSVLRIRRFAPPEEAISRENDDEPMPNSVELRGLRSPVMKGNLPMNIDGKINKDN